VIGTVLGKYRIEGEPSRGGMGAVYRARREILERSVDDDGVAYLVMELAGEPLSAGIASRGALAHAHGPL
jgi:hypothetical protein